MVSKFHQIESKWKYQVVDTDQWKKPRLKLEKYVQILDQENKNIIEALDILLFLSKGNEDEIVNKIIGRKKKLIEKISEYFNKSIEEHYLAGLMPHIYFSIFGKECIKDYGSAKIRLHNAYGHIFEEFCIYEYNDKETEFTFYTNDKMIATRLFHKFVTNMITKIEFLPIEANTFERIYFDMANTDYFTLKNIIEVFAKEQNFKIIDI